MTNSSRSNSSKFGNHDRKRRKRAIFQNLTRRLALACFSIGIVAALTLSAHTQGFRVEGAGLEATPAQYTGPCPAEINFKGKIQANGTGRVKYTFVRSDGGRGPESSVDFEGPGVKYVSTTWTLGGATLPHFEGWIAIRIISPNGYDSNKATFVLDCGSNPPQSKQQPTPQPAYPKLETRASRIPRAQVTPAPAPQTPTRVRPPTPLPMVINDVDFNNWGFELGSEGWTKEGDAFIFQPTYQDNVVTQRVLSGMEYRNDGIGGDFWKDMPYPIGIKGNYWIGTYESRPSSGIRFANTQGDAPTGTLTSTEFRITKNLCDFLIGGGSDPRGLFVELDIKQRDGSWQSVARKTSFRNSEELYRTEFNLREYRGEVARIRIVDNATGAWGHINVDDFRFLDQIPGNSIFMRDNAGGRYRLDGDAPVWGVADTHAHPAAEEAFGKKMYIGSPSTPMPETYSTDLCVRNHSIGGNSNLNDALTGQLDPHLESGWPDFVGFPRFNSHLHQKYHVDFIKRAWQGGLRLMSALAVNNMYLATRALGHGDNGEAIDDESVMYRSLDEVKRMAQQNSSWMEIAYSPEQARRIIRQGKLAIVLGVEADVFGNFKAPDCRWQDCGFPRGGCPDRRLVTITESNADSLLNAKLTEYYDYGVRQVTPIHYLNKPFGGAAVFNGSTFLPQINFYNNEKVKGGISRGVGFTLYEDFNAAAAFTSDGLSYADYAGRIQKQDEGAEISMVNADGLTSVGQTLFSKLMEKHFIVDQEHGSYETKDDVFRISTSHGNYPVISSHTDPLGLSFSWLHGPVRWSGSFSPAGVRNFNDNRDNILNFGTTNIRNIAHEMELSDDNYRNIRQRSGTVGVFLTLNRKRAYAGSLSALPDSCSGSSTTFTQMYLYSLEKMGSKGVALASDLPMVEAIGPRFGPYAAWGLKEENDDLFKKDQRTTQRVRQRNGIKYDTVSRSYQPALFESGDIEGWEEDLWKALAAWQAGVDPSSVATSSELGHADRIRNYARGLYVSRPEDLLKPNFLDLGTGDGPAEQGAMFCLNNNIVDPGTLRDRLSADHINKIIAMIQKVRPIWNLWKAKDGSNEPLRRYRTGNRDWDFNLDGLAHYGLLPDLIQDLRNIGLPPGRLTPMFRSAEDYIEMWEKTRG